MANKPKPPIGKKDRQNLDKETNRKRTSAKRQKEREILQKFVQNWKKMIFKTYKRSGLEAAKEEHAYCVKFFEQAAKERHLSPEETKSVIENFDSFLNTLRKKNRKH